MTLRTIEVKRKSDHVAIKQMAYMVFFNTCSSQVQAQMMIKGSLQEW